MLKLNRKGSEVDLIFTVVIIFATAISVIFAHYILGQISPGLVAAGAPQYAFDYSNQALEVFNYGIIFLTIGFGMAAVLSSFMIKSHPVFFVASMFGFVVLIFISSIFANIFDEIMLTSPMATTATTTFSKLFPFVRNIPYIMGFLWVVMVIALFGKWERGI